MSNGKLKAQYNRVRTSVALQGNSMWTHVIGVDQESQGGSNSVIEASLKAPRHGGRGRQARREAAQALIEEAGYEPAVSSFEGLVALAKAQGSIGGGKRGACRICGGMGHMTKQCKNHLSSFYQKGKNEEGVDAMNIEGALPVVHESSDISSLSSDSTSDTESRKRKDRKRKEKHRESTTHSSITGSKSHRRERSLKKESKRQDRRRRDHQTEKESKHKRRRT